MLAPWPRYLIWFARKKCTSVVCSSSSRKNTYFLISNLLLRLFLIQTHMRILELSREIRTNGPKVWPRVCCILSITNTYPFVDIFVGWDQHSRLWITTVVIRKNRDLNGPWYVVEEEKKIAQILFCCRIETGPMASHLFNCQWEFFFLSLKVSAVNYFFAGYFY